MADTWGQLGDRLINAAMERRVPIMGQFELTSRCNLKCKMCYICNSVNNEECLLKEKSARDWIELAGEAKKEGLLYLLLTGGEVFLRKDFSEIYEVLCRMGFIIQINTNGTLITPEIARWLGKIPPSKVSVTLYGASVETYENVCGNGKSYTAAVNGIDLLIENGIKVDIKTTVIQRNVEDFDKIAAFAEERGLEFGVVNYISPRREGYNTIPVEERLTADQLLLYEEKVEAYFMSKKPEEVSLDKCSNLLYKAGNGPFECTVGRSSFWVTWDGLMITCGLNCEPFTMPFETGFIKAWEDLGRAVREIPPCKECSSCSLKVYCMTCPTRLKSETGSFTKPAPYLCRLARNEKNRRVL